VHVTGNTVIDALLEVAARCPAPPPGARRLVLVTAHRRESFGAPLERICAAIRELADARLDAEFLFPVHPNPAVRDRALPALSGHPRIRLSPPLDYGAFVAAMKRAHFVLTDSGGVQEEAPALGKPVLVLRDETERPEALAEGVARLVGTDRSRIVAECARLLDDELHYAAMARGVSPYGDGRAAARIAAVLRADLATKGARAA
jgi:UDP-N-acetylglucosamine 2-epimerase (non-hydrolysing)